ncbi:MAG: 16S rRNA (cytidine(1402)-2'-O)-methyltransferase [Sulfurimonas sp.]|uniref:16S rRNA (cytidine(1402)-2'-O)-methyltransferase n=1 Tax=Sulfurimonas sp. TaxID=2022749 RepID=UPI0025D90991|nr:16S rRNA (cytidine(1402)-2'-O)-methyltransferase [Sulfurimonas sp.]MCK9491270.1 16S rRNA (cytidine(1402)-2'-O)-methyltransferase [Sulfurimonas sp.]
MLSLVPTPIGNISDISLRAIEVLREADILLCEDTRVTKKLIHILKERYNTSFKEDQRFISLHSHNEKSFLEELDVSFFDKEVVYVSDAGMPGISDPGQLLVRYAQENGIDYDVLPGSNALLTAFVASGFVETRLLFWGFLPHKGSDRAASLNGALFSGFATVLYESPRRLNKLLQEIEKEQPLRKLFLAKEISKKFQTYFSGNASELQKAINDNFRGEWVVVISPSEKQNSSAISENDILELDLPKKVQAKLICKITQENTKSCYERLLKL